MFSVCCGMKVFSSDSNSYDLVLKLLHSLIVFMGFLALLFIHSFFYSKLITYILTTCILFRYLFIREYSNECRLKCVWIKYIQRIFEYSYTSV